MNALARLRNACTAYQQLRTAAGQIKRLQAYTHPTSNMLADLGRWKAAYAAAESALNVALDPRTLPDLSLLEDV